VRVDLGKTEKLKFLIDTGAEISIVRGNSMLPGINYEPTDGVTIKGVSDTMMRTEGIVLLKLCTLDYETTHLFHVMGNDFGCRYDGILGQDFWKREPQLIIVIAKLLWVT
jgi:hypothetical protein